MNASIDRIFRPFNTFGISFANDESPDYFWQSIFLIRFVTQTAKTMKQTRAFILTVLITLLSAGGLRAQFGSPLLTYKNDVPTQKECGQITSRKLIVMNQRWDLDKVDEFKRKKQFSELEEYKDNCAAYSNAYIDLIREKWNLHDTFEVKSFKQVRDLFEAGETEYIVLALVHITVEKDSENKNVFSVDYAYTGEESAKDANGFSSQDFKSLVLFPIEQLNEMETSFAKMYMGISLLHQVPTKEDIHYAVDVMNDIVKRKAADNKFTDNTIKQYSARLKDYTLAINKKDWDDYISIADAQVYYPYAIEVMEQDKFNSLITTPTPGYAYAFKLGNYIGIMFSDTKEIVYMSAPIDIPAKKTTPQFSLREFNKINEAVTGTKIDFKE